MIDPQTVTVVVPLYNGIDYIGEVIGCLSAQTCQDFRVLYIDDGSSDRTVEVVNQNKRPQDRLVEKANSGLYDTLNLAGDLVETEWCAFLFQDDRVAPTWIDAMAHFLDPAMDCLWFAIDTIDGAGALREKGLSTGRVEPIPPSEGAWRSALKRGTFWTISGSVTKTTTLRAMRFRPDLPHCADYEFLLRGLGALTFTYVEGAQVAIRQHDGAASARNLGSGSDIEERLKVLAEQLRHGPYPATVALRVELTAQMLKLIVLRAAGSARRGGVITALKHLSRLRRALMLLGA